MKPRKKIHRRQNLAKILTEKFVLKKKFFAWFFLNCPGGKIVFSIVFENLGKKKNLGKLHYLTLITLAVT